MFFSAGTGLFERFGATVLEATGKCHSWVHSVVTGLLGKLGQGKRVRGWGLTLISLILQLLRAGLAHMQRHDCMTEAQLRARTAFTRVWGVH